jgi:hypothetical protein
VAHFSRQLRALLSTPPQDPSVYLMNI